MPELPEVEVVRRGLEPLVKGRRIVDIIGDGLPLRAPVPLEELRRAAVGSRVSELKRRGKFLLLHLDYGARILLHLGMTGKLYPAAAADPLRKHDHLRLCLDRSQDGPEEIRFNDCRRFGLVDLWPSDQAHEIPRLLRSLGPEPLEGNEFNPEYLLKRCKKKKTPIKQILMDNRVVVGIGNIYANEILFAARLSPFTPALDLTLAQTAGIVEKARIILEKAIASGGSTIADFTNAAGESGYFQVQLAVYGRQGAPCNRCQNIIQRQPQSGRATFFCPLCQNNL